MSWGNPNSTTDLQTTISGSTAIPPSLADSETKYLMAHHPITCRSKILQMHEDGSMQCEHALSPAENPRNQLCVNTSIAILLIELLHEREFGKEEL